MILLLNASIVRFLGFSYSTSYYALHVGQKISADNILKYFYFSQKIGFHIWSDPIF